MTEGVTRVVLPDGTPVWARVTLVEEVALDPPAPPGGHPEHPPAPTSAAGSPRATSTYSDTGSGYSDTGLGYSDTGFRDRVTARMDDLRDLLNGVAGSLADGLRDARPDQVSVSFGIELAGSAGRVVGLLADGSAKSTLNVTLTWRGGPPQAAGSGG